MDKYTKELLDCSSKLDAMVEGYGQITGLANAIVNDESSESTIQLLRKLSAIAEDTSLTNETKKMAALLKDSLVRYYGHIRLLEICDNEPEKAEDNKSLKELLEIPEQVKPRWLVLWDAYTSR